MAELLPGERAGDARRAIAAFEQRDLPWPCGLNGGGETPGLMLGTAGIGYGMLRLYDPSLESVLLIRPQ